jgi:hypothetical protein
MKNIFFPFQLNQCWTSHPPAALACPTSWAGELRRTKKDSKFRSLSCLAGWSCCFVLFWWHLPSLLPRSRLSNSKPIFQSCQILVNFIEGSSEVELSTVWTDETAKVRCRCAKRQKSRETPCFANVCVPGGSKSRLAKAAGAKDESSKIARRFGAKQIWKSKS